MLFETIVVGPLGVNCYILGCETTREGVIVDPGASPEKIMEAVAGLRLTIKYVLNTHGHFDHVGANSQIIADTNAKLLIHPEDTPFLARAKESAAMYGVTTENSPPPDGPLDDGLLLSFGRYEITVIHTPGHTRGGCSLYVDHRVLTGDTLFAASVGRTDLPGGDEQVLLASIRSKLLLLPDDTTVFPGHGESTTIGKEKRCNPYLAGR